MKRLLIAAVFAAMACTICNLTFAQDEQVNGKVTAVTLHRSQALVTRTLEIEGAAGAQEIIVGNLPENIVDSSLFAESDEQVEVRAVQFRDRAVGNSPREEVRKLQDEMKTLSESIELNRKTLELLNKQSLYLDKLETFVAPTATTEITKGVLNAATLEQLTNFSFAQRKTILEEQVKLSKEAQDLAEKQTLMQRKLAEITSGSSKTIREAVLYLQKNDAEKRNVRLNYLVANCGWSPSYVVRGSTAQPNVKLEYNGLIYQMSGEDWSNVTLTLSTASPALSAAGPGLAPLEVTLNASGQEKGGSGPQQAAQIAIQRNPKDEIYNLFEQQKLALVANQATTNFDDNAKTSWSINKFANDLACAALVGDASVVNMLKAQMEDISEEPSLSYTIGSPINLSSRSSQQIVRIVQTELPSTFYHVATPILTSYVFREAELSNNSKEDLLAGPISVYLDGKFVGRGEIPTVARGQSFVVGFGADPQLRSRRELAEKTDGVNGGNRELKFDYRVVIENFKEEAAKIRVVDRLPTSNDGSDIRVTLVGGMKDELSDDKVYQRTERPEGILRWEIEAPARSVAEKARMIDYSFTVEYDRKFQIMLPTSTAQLEQQFKQLQRSRSKR